MSERISEVSEILTSQEKKQPKAIITVTRATAQEEHCQIVLNAEEATVESLFDAVHAAGEALCKRVEECNQKQLSVQDPIPSMQAGQRR